MKFTYIVLFLFIIGIFSGCEEEIDVPYVVDEDEIARYITDSDLGRAFFPNNNYIIQQPFDYPQDSDAVYIHQIDSVKRTIIPTITLHEYQDGYFNVTQEFGTPFGSSMDAEVEVRDRLFLRTLRIEGTDTTTYTVAQDVSRYGYFMKLGDDGERFKGWLMRGFNGGVPGTIAQGNRSIVDLYHIELSNEELWASMPTTYETFTSQIIRSQYDGNGNIDTETINVETVRGYTLLSIGTSTFIERVAPGDEVKAEIRVDNNSMFFTVGIKTDNSFFQQTIQPDSNQSDVNFTIPNDPTGTWGFIYLQEYYRNTGDTFSVPEITSLLNRKWVIPYYIQ